MKQLYLLILLFWIKVTLSQTPPCVPNSISSLGNRPGEIDTICFGDTISYQILEPNCLFYSMNIEFSWLLKGVDGPDSLYGNFIKVSYSQPGLYYRNLYGSSSLSPDSSIIGNAQIVVLPCPPTAQFTSSKQKICTNECITFKDKSKRLPSQWEWFFEGGLPAYFNGQKPPPICYSDTGKFDVKLIVRSKFGIDSLTQLNYVEVQPGPEPITVDQSFQLKEGDEITLQACARGDGYQWQPLVAVMLNEDTLLTVQPDEAQVYTATIRTANGCRADCVYDVKVLNGLLVPTGFSPNGDGTNDFFRILNTNIKLSNFSIYNRWGNLVFSTTTITDGWDGTYQTTEQELGVYTWTATYTITKTGKQKTAKGNVTLVR